MIALSGILEAASAFSSEKDRYPARTAIVELAMESLEERYDPERYRFEVTPRWIPGSLARMDRSVIREVVPDGNIERNTNFDVTYEANGRRRHVQVQLQLEIEKRIPVMADRVRAGQIITRDDWMLRWVPVSRNRGQLVTESAEMEGKTVRRTLARGEPVRNADLSTEYMVEAGDVVTLIFMRNGMRIDINAIARQNGALNETIRLYSDETRKTYMGNVNGSEEVHWVRTL